jgi:hypothetical protein
MIFANPFGATVGPATEGKSGISHFGPVSTAPPAVPLTPAASPPVFIPVTTASMSSNTKLALGLVAMAALGYGVHKLTRKR